MGWPKRAITVNHWKVEKDVAQMKYLSSPRDGWRSRKRIDFRSRRNLRSHLKQMTVNEAQRLHAKNRDAIMVKPFWRLSISLNDEPEDLHVLPTIDAGL